MSSHQIVQEGIFYPHTGECLYSFPQLTANPVSQLLCGRYGKGDDKYLVYCEVPLQDEPEKQASNSIGFSRTCTGLYKVCSLKGAV
ncbi:hypothetical protein ES703_49674 [subsurface metagenome]